MFKECIVKQRDEFLPERFTLNSKWCYSFIQDMYYIDGRYFTDDEFHRYFITAD